VTIEVDLYQEIRQLYAVEHCSQREIARRLGISRNTVKKYCQGACIPGQRKPYQGRIAPVLTTEVIEFIHSCLEQDKQEGVKKQQHTAKRIYDRLVEEKGFMGGESTVRQYVQQLRQNVNNAYIPLSFEPGEAVQVDWGAAKVYIKGVKQTVHLFCMRLCFSCDIFVMAFTRENEESFLEGHRAGFEYFGGVARKEIFDNSRLAVKEGWGTHVVKEQQRFMALKAHYAFATEYCNLAEGHEKGLVEGLVGYIRRNVLVPLVHVDSIEELNQIILDRCIKYRSHTIRGRSQTVGKDYETERASLIPLPLYPFDTAIQVTASVNEFGIVRFDGSQYSVPLHLVGKNVTVKGYGTTVRIYYHNEEVAAYPRSYTANTVQYQLSHYIDLLEKRPRAVLNAKPVKQADIPQEILQWGQRLPAGNRDMVKLLRLVVDYGTERILKEIKALDISSPTIELLRSRLTDSDDNGTVDNVIPFPNDVSVKEVSLNAYDVLLAGGDKNHE
jgi:transposase